MDSDFFETKDGKLYLRVKIIPGSSKTELAGVHEGRLRIRVAAAPEDGKANARLVAFLSKLFDCPKKEIVIKSGEKSRLKTICLPPNCGEKAAACQP
ncbi:MAG: DUF167 domain-containing protein [Spirochaetaceae bacterium]|jgi:uncharacterized protein (TIGR00251 family)|nr:DUF167 domain-containing protein [Spirochaetaceae bacterium]